MRIRPAAPAAASRNLGTWKSGNLGILRSVELEIWEFGNLETWKSRNLGSKKSQNWKISKLKSALPKMSARSGLVGTKSSWLHLVPFQAIVSFGRKNAKAYFCLPIFHGGPMGSIHPVVCSQSWRLVLSLDKSDQLPYFGR